MLGINPLRLIADAAVVVAVVAGGFTIRHHYVNLGWKKAIVAVKKQDDRAVAPADNTRAILRTTRLVRNATLSTIAGIIAVAAGWDKFSE